MNSHLDYIDVSLLWKGSKFLLVAKVNEMYVFPQMHQSSLIGITYGSQTFHMYRFHMTMEPTQALKLQILTSMLP